MMEPLPTSNHSEVEEAAKSLVQCLFNETNHNKGDPHNNKKSDYLALRLCGFAVFEAEEVAGIRHRTVLRARKNDPDFKRLEDASAGPERGAVRNEIIGLLFTRNLALVLRKDHAVLRQALGLQKDEDGNVVMPNNQDYVYLNRMRAAYSPQQLDAVQTLMREVGKGRSFDYGRFITSISRTTVTEKVEFNPGDANGGSESSIDQQGHQDSQDESRYAEAEVSS